jgi:hypothetical protein
LEIDRGGFLVSFDMLQVVLIGVGSGFGSAFGVEVAKALVQYLKGVKVVKRNGS